MTERYKENWRLYNSIFLVIAVLCSVPVLCYTKQTGLDPSWQYALNRFTAQGYVFGKDMVFTYGPLGFLAYCMNEGNNVLVAIIMWVSLLVFHGYILYQYLFILKKSENSIVVAVSLLLYILSSTLLHIEYYLCYMALFALMLVLNGYKKNIYLFDGILMLSLYIKFSQFIMVFGLAVLYILLGYFYNKILYKYCLIRTIVGMALSPVIYFGICEGSLIDFKNFIKGSIEIASGYSVAMSAGQHDIYMIWIILAIVAFLICIILGIRSGLYNFMTMTLTGFCLFMCYKHAFVRADEWHITHGMNGMLAFLSVIPAFLDWHKVIDVLGGKKKLYFSLMAFVFSIVIVQNGFDSVNIVKQIRERVFNMPRIYKTALEQAVDGLSPLPQSMLAEIGNASVTIYPWEISYCVSNELNYVPLAVVQAYSAYTPYLDRISAEKLANDDAPEYILCTLDAIDNRWPLIECPQTWEVIRNHYYIQLQEGNLFLLKRRMTQKNVEYSFVKETDCTLSDIIELDGADYFKITTQLNVKGKLAKLFWKIPEINMHVYYSDGTEETHRVLLDMFTEGLELGTLATNNETLIDLLNDTGHIGSVSKIAFEGDGVKFYRHDIKIAFYKTLTDKGNYPNEAIKTAYAEEILHIDLSSFEVKEESINYAVDIETGNQYYRRLTGWAYALDSEQFMDDCEICVEIDKKYYKCEKVSREDVKQAFRLASDLVGFTVLYNSGESGKICIIDTKRNIIYKAK